MKNNRRWKAANKHCKFCGDHIFFNAANVAINANTKTLHHCEAYSSARSSYKVLSRNCITKEERRRYEAGINNQIQGDK
jgi:hypothetical protein